MSRYSAESPANVRTIANALNGWISKLGEVWVEGQLTELTIRGANAYGTLRDTDADISLRFTARGGLIRATQPPLSDGARVVVRGRIDYYVRRGSISLAISELRQVGIGELLARLEQRKQLLAAEGLFAPEHKQPLPLLPHRIGLICGRSSAAERDVVQNARLRWPAVEFDCRYTAVQGLKAAPEVIDALRSLDTGAGSTGEHRPVDVIVIARGGGSVEDLLPFSDEGLIRAVFACRTPVVSAIGHEPDQPLLDLVADLRASTPTDAAKRIVPDVAEMRASLIQTRERLRRAVSGRIGREQAWLTGIRSRPCLANPAGDLLGRRSEVELTIDRARRALSRRLEHERNDLGHRLARVRALSPRATMQRGYAVLADSDGTAIRSVDQTSDGQPLSAWVSDGRFAVITTGDAERIDSEPGKGETTNGRYT